MVPVSDGGDGFLAVLFHYRPDVLEVAARVLDPAGRPVTAAWGWDPDGGVAYLESATAIGIRLLEPVLCDPLEVTSAGLGRLIRTAAALAPAEIVVGLGGSATVDGGFGMARELGFRFEDHSGNAIERPADLSRLTRIHPPAGGALFGGTRLLALADVIAPLHGPEGAARAFGPQKGAGPEGVARLAEGLERLEEVWRRDLKAPADLADRPGAGAAGGLGAALSAFLGAEIASGAQWCARVAGIEQALAGAGGIVTGEGRFDRQSHRGKATGHVLALARAVGVPSAVVCAAAEEQEEDGPLVVDAATIGRRSGDRLGREDLARLVQVVLDRWETALPADILSP
jgi:glycerate kinase